jgi:hypothetical protein
MVKKLQRETSELKADYERSQKALLEGNSKKKVEVVVEKKVEGSSFGNNLLRFIQKTGRTMYMISLIAAYSYVFIPRFNSEANLKYSDSHQILEFCGEDRRPNHRAKNRKREI